MLELLEKKDISINVISKLGTTIELAIAFRIFRDYLEKNMEYRKLNQLGVEAYKKNMFTLLGKPGFERDKILLEQLLCR